MTWQLTVAKTAAKKLASKRFPTKDKTRVLKALAELRDNPFTYGVVHLKYQSAGFRYRAGNYRILFDIIPNERRVEVHDIQRRTTTTYRKR